MNEPVLSGVSFPDGSRVDFTFNFSREDLKNSKALTDISVKNMYNSEVKKWQLGYSYFMASGVTPNISAETGNDFSKRLRLDKITEQSVVDTFKKVTQYIYNTTALNPRNSGNLDFWGYNVTPLRNNSYRSPRIQLDPTDYGINPAYGHYWSGANLYPDSTYGKAAMLEKIVYPTGGYTIFEYEGNQAYSPVNYFNNDATATTVTWTQADFNTQKGVALAGRTEEEVVFYWKAIENAPRPTGTGPVTCIGGMQDEKIVRFEIKSTDNAVSTYVDVIYANLLGGASATLTLPVNKIYNIKVVYDPAAVCAFTYPFTIQTYQKYYISPYDKLVGGVRIKKMTSYDGSGKTLTKSYDYNNADGHSSGMVGVIPDYRYYRSTRGTFTGALLLHTRHITRGSSPTSTLSYFNGSPLIYKRVKEKEVDGSLTEREYEDIYSLYGPMPYPYLPYQDFPNLRGMLNKETVKDAAGSVKQEKLFTYNKVQVTLGDSCRNLVTGCIANGNNYTAPFFVVDNYRMRTSRLELTNEETRLYDGTNYISTNTTRQYDVNKYYMTSSAFTDSKSQQRTNTFTYAYNGTGAVYTAMQQQNILSPTIATSTYLVMAGLNRIQTRTNYALWNSGLLPAPASVEKSYDDQAFFTEVTFNNYDDKGNVLQYTGKDGLLTSFIWGYNKQYPVAKIVGKGYNDMVSVSGINMATVNNPSTDNALLTELNKLRLVSGAMVTTYLYKPLVGVVKEMDLNGNAISYEYDGFNRLQLIRDKDNNILKKFCYNYTGQQTVCSETITLPPAGANPCANCIEINQKCINNICEAGVKHVTSSVLISGRTYQCTFYYTWSDGSSSQSYTATALNTCEDQILPPVE